jgi:hypothetical protein
MSEHRYSSARDMTRTQRHCSTGMLITRLCEDCKTGKMPTGGKVLRFNRWRCAECVAKRAEVAA